MTRLLLVALALATLLGPAVAQAGRGDSWEDRRENRRDARRAGIIAGAVAGGIAGAAARDRAEERYEECLEERGYDDKCDRRRNRDERDARRAARRSAVVVGSIARDLRGTAHAGTTKREPFQLHPVNLASADRAMAGVVWSSPSPWPSAVSPATSPVALI
jgi:hypothetical protein